MLKMKIESSWASLAHMIRKNKFAIEANVAKGTMKFVFSLFSKLTLCALVFFLVIFLNIFIGV